MLTTLTILSLDQGKIWRDEPAAERPAAARDEAAKPEAARPAWPIRLSRLTVPRPLRPARPA